MQKPPKSDANERQKIESIAGPSDRHILELQIENKISSAITALKESNRTELERIANEKHEPRFKRLRNSSALIITFLVLSNLYAYLGIKQRVTDEATRVIDQKLIEPQLTITLDNALSNRAVPFIVQRLRPIEDRVATLASTTESLKMTYEHLTVDISKRYDDLNAGIRESEKRLEELRNQSEFSLTVLRASSDDRNAFDQLGRWAHDGNFAYHDLAADAWRAIVDTDAEREFSVTKAAIWQDSRAATNYSLNSMKSFYHLNSGSRYAPLRQKLITEIQGRNDFEKGAKLSFYVEVYKKDPSLKVVSQIGRYLNQEPEADYKPLAIDSLLKWWERNKEKYLILGKTNVTKQN